MKKVNVEHKVETSPSQDKVKYQDQQSLYISPSGKFSVLLIPNRREVEVQMNLITSGSYSASSDVIFDSNEGSEGYLTNIVTSQVGVSIFLETRVLSSKEIKRRAMEAYQKEIERRKKLIDMEEVETDL